MRKTDSNPNSGTRLSLDTSEFGFFSSLPFFSLTFFPLPFFQNKLDKMQIGSSEDVNDLNYYYDNEWWVARGGN